MSATTPFDTVQAAWTQLAEPARAAITLALRNAAGTELARLDSFYPYNSTPNIDVLGIVVDPAGVRRIHFLAHDTNYNSAQSGSDWANHYVLVGTAVLDGEVLGAIELKTAVSSTIREADWGSYEPAPVVEEVRDQVLGELGVIPPAPEMETIRIVRCPHCGSTDAGEVDGMYEITRMGCATCGHTELCDTYQIKDDWNVSYERRKDRPRLPSFVPPLATSEPGFELRGEMLDETRLLVHPGLGYAIAIPGQPYLSGPPGGQSAIVSADVWIRVVLRTERFYSDRDDAAALLRHELEAAARVRAKADSVFDIQPAPIPPGATTSMYATYPCRPRDDDEDDMIELLAVTVKDDKPSYFKAVFLHIACPTRRLDSQRWADLRAALLANQTWQ